MTTTTYLILTGISLFILWLGLCSRKALYYEGEKCDWLDLKIANPKKIEWKRKKSPIYLWILITFIGLIPFANIILAILLILVNLFGAIILVFDRNYCSLSIFSNCFWFTQIFLKKSWNKITSSFINFLKKEI